MAKSSQTEQLLTRCPSPYGYFVCAAAAGIAKADAEGRTVDVHSLRHTFATMLSQAGVRPRTAQELMRHSDIRLTMTTYTHLGLLDTAGAVEALPSVGRAESRIPKKVRTGTDN